MDKVIDVSAEDGRIEWPKVKAWGCNGAILKATNALDFIDPEYERNVDGCLVQSIPFGSYMVIHPWEPIIDQFEAYMDCVSLHTRVHCVDWELAKGERASKASLALIVGMNYIQEQLAVKPCLYLNLDYLIHRLQYKRRVFSLCDVWYSNPSEYGMAKYPPAHPAPIMHQYTFKAKVPGVPGACDVNRLYRDAL